MSIKKNLYANYAGQIYVISIGIIITPFYLQYLGAEAYGLVGFFALMHAWLGLLDLGLSPTLGRQVACARGQENGFYFFKRLLKSFEIIFFILAITIISVISLYSEWLANNWINAEELANYDVMYCIVLMGVMIGIRWFSSLYRSGINGMEDQVWLNVINVIIISLKFIGALALLEFISNDIRNFFEYQLLIAFVELLVLASRFYHTIPSTKGKNHLILFDWSAVKSVAPFSLSIAYATGLWVLVSQSDKLILSGFLSLSEFGYFSLVALLAGGITMLSGPVALAIIPRMTMLLSEGKHVEMLKIYREASQLVTLIVFSVAIIIGLYAEPLIFAWTGDTSAAEWGAEVLIWFSVGNAFLAIGAFQYYLQSAYGNLRLHVYGSTVTAAIQLPLLYIAVNNYGAFGAGIAWSSFHLLGFLLWTPVVHRKILPGFHLKWLLKDILPILVVITITAFVLRYLYPLGQEENRLLSMFKMIGIGLMLLCFSLVSLPVVYERLFKGLKAKNI
jgi:O-antigen/teichoic acid export membrane protein